MTGVFHKLYSPFYLPFFKEETMNEQELVIKIGKRIKAIRANRNISQNELSKKCQIEKAGMSKIEAGLSNPTVRTLLKISQALEVSIADLFKD